MNLIDNINQNNHFKDARRSQALLPCYYFFLTFRLFDILPIYLVQPNTDIFSYLAKDFRENKNLTCKKCTFVSLCAQVTKKRPIFF